MKKLILIIICLGITSLQNKAQTVKDMDGNEYHTVTIGTQVWLQENLKVIHYRNGDDIPKVTDNNEWENLKTGAYCDYNNNAEIAGVCGKLYNWFAASDSRGLCPTGWHVPTDAEWSILIENLGGESTAGGKMKESGTEDWKEPNGEATNESDITALPGGCRQQTGKFEGLSSDGYWWSSIDKGGVGAGIRWVVYMNASIGSAFVSKACGITVRCVRD